MAGTLATLVVKLEGDTSGFHKDMDAAGKKAQGTGGILKGALSTALGFGAASLAMAGFGGALDVVGKGAIGMNAELETSTLQFTTLMGNSDEARKHVEGLFDFAAKTPFETGPVIEASRIMETFGGSALDSKKNLTLFGDAAAAVSAPINEVGFWMSRAYSDIQAGRPFGEAAARLSELGIITPQTRNELEKMQKAGASNSEVWGTLTGSLERFDGAMEKQAGTFDGMVSTFMDGVNMMMAQAFRPLFESLKGVLANVNELMASPGFQGGIKAVGEGIAAGIGMAVNILGEFIGILAQVWTAIQPVIQALVYIFDVISSGDDVVAGLGETFGNLGEKLSTVFTTALDTVIGLVQKFGPIVLDAFLNIASEIIAQAPAMVDAVSQFLGSAIDWIINVGVPKAAEAIGPLAEKFFNWIFTTAIPGLVENLPKILSAIVNFIVTNGPKIAGALLKWAGELIGWIAKNVLPKLPGALLSIAVALLSWISKTATDLAQGAAKMAMEFLRSFIQWIAKLPGQFADSFRQFLAGLPAWGLRLLSAAADMAGKFIKGFIDALISLPGKIADVIRNAFRNIRIDVGPFHISGSGVTIDLPNIKLPSFAVGAWNIPADMVAGIHKGEMIVPASIAEEFRSFMSGGGRSTGIIPRLPADAQSGSSRSQMAVFNAPLVYIENYNGDADGADELSRLVGARVRLAVNG